MERFTLIEKSHVGLLLRPDAGVQIERLGDKG